MGPIRRPKGEAVARRAGADRQVELNFDVAPSFHRARPCSVGNGCGTQFWTSLTSAERNRANNRANLGADVKFGYMPSCAHHLFISMKPQPPSESLDPSSPEGLG